MTLADGTHSVYSSGKELAYDHVTRYKVVPFVKATDPRLTIKVDSQRMSMKGILLLFMEPYTTARGQEIPDKSPRYD